MRISRTALLFVLRDYTTRNTFIGFSVVVGRDICLYHASLSPRIVVAAPLMTTTTRRMVSKYWMNDKNGAREIRNRKCCRREQPHK